MQGMSSGILANNMLGSSARMAAAGFAGAVLINVIALAAAALFLLEAEIIPVTGLLAASGAILMILPSSECEL